VCAACALIPEACLAFAVGQLKQASLATSWHVRKAATRFLTLFVPRHCFLLGQGEQRVVYKMLARLLEDPQLEVITLNTFAHAKPDMHSYTCRCARARIWP
jgi:hypothetical protein